MTRSLILVAFLVLAGCGDDGGSSAVDATPPDADPLAPICAITAPGDGIVVAFDAEVTFEATAADADGNPLGGASVVWTSNLASTPLGTGLSITLELPTPGEHTVTCTATDDASRTGTDRIDVTSQSPFAVINHPGDGETRPASDPIQFTGDARDFEDPLIDDADMVWTSSLDGALGTGRDFTDTLSAGTNVITLTVTDSDSNTYSTSISLTITP